MKSPVTLVRLPRPSNEDEFERLVRDVAKIKYRSDNFQLYGRRGQKQHGIDVTGNEDGDMAKRIVLQAKCYDPKDSFSEGAIKDHVEKAFKHKIQFKTFVWATTLDRDTKMQDEAVAMTGWLIENGYPRGTEVIIWSWSEFTEFAHESSQIYTLLDPVTDEQRATLLGAPTVQSQDLTSPELNIGMEQAQQLTALAQISMDLAKGGRLGPTWDQLSKNAIKKPHATLSLIEGLLSDEKNLNDVDRSRAFGIKGNCYLALKSESDAIECYQEAYKLTPNRDASKTNYALSLGLQGEQTELIRFAKAHLTDAEPNNELAATVLYFIYDLSLIPKSCLKAERVRLSLIEHERDTRPVDEAIQELRALFAMSPDNDRIRQELAAALLSKVLDSESLIAAEDLGESRREAAKECEDIYTELWTKITSDQYEDYLPDVSVPHNLSVILRINGKIDRACEILSHAMELRNDSSVLALQFAICMLDREQLVTEEVIALLDESRDAYRIRLRWSLERGRWDETLEHIATLEKMSDDKESGFLAGIKQIAEISALDDTSRKDALSEVFATKSTDVRELVLLTQLARRFKDAEAEERLFGRAKNSFNEEAGIEARYALAHEAKHHDDSDLIFELLEGHVDYGRDTEQLRLLAETATEEHPSRERDKRVFDNIDDTLFSIERYQNYKSIYLENAGRPNEARRAWRDLHDMSPSLRSWLGLFRTSIKLNDSHRQRHLLGQQELLSFHGSTLDQLQLAHHLINAERFDDAQMVAVRAMKQPGAMKSPLATARFSTLFLARGHVPLESVNVVESGAFVKLEDASGEIFEGIIDADKDYRWGKSISSQNHLVALALGKSSGETIEIEGQIGNSIWTIKEVLSEIIRMIRFIPTVHEIDFGSDALIFRTKMVGEDISPILDLIRRDATRRDEFIETILTKNIPITFAADSRDSGPLSIAAGFEMSERDLPVAVGISPSFQTACEHALEINSGVVLDSLTIQTAMRLGILQELAERFGPLIVPEICLREMREKVEELGLHDGERMTLSAKGEQVYRDVTEKDQMPALIQQIKDDLEVIEKTCRVEAVVFPDTDNDVFRLLMSNAPLTASLISMALEHKVPLLSEDRNLRAWSENLGAPLGVWLNVAVWILRLEKVITPEKYVQAYAMLSSLRHRHLSIDAQVLIEAYDLKRGEETKLEFEQLITELGGPKADIPSHVSVAVFTMNYILKLNGEGHHAAKAASLLLNQIFRSANKRHMKIIVNEFYNISPRVVREHLNAYLIGHFYWNMLKNE